MRHVLLITTFILFAVAYACDYAIASRVDTAALAAEHYRQTFSVNVGLAPEGGLLIERVDNAPVVAHHLQVPNNTRNLRLYVAGDSSESALYLESAKPHLYYRISLPLPVYRESTGFRWIGPTAFVMSTPSANGANAQYVIDVHTLSIKQLESLSNLRLIVPGARREIDPYL